MTAGRPRVLVSGGSIAGLAAAYWYDRAGWDVQVLERADAFREGGQNVDVRGVARQVVERMGVLDAVRAMNTTETGTVIVDEQGDTIVELPQDDEGEGATAELEILRGDLAGVVRDVLPDTVRIRFGDRIVDVSQTTEQVTVETESGLSIDADLLVIAEGVRSSTRDLVFGGEVEQRDLGITMEFGTIPRIDSDDDRWNWYNAVGGRQVHLRPDPHGTTRAMLAYRDDVDVEVPDDATDDERRRARYSGAGWQTDRVLDGFAASDDVYVDELTQIVAPTWSKGRIVLLGDAAWCVTPMGGGGSSLALTGAYVLAAKTAGARSRDALVDALDAYDEWMRPLVDAAQGMPPGIKTFAYPRTPLGLRAQHAAHHVLTSKPIAPLMAKVTHLVDTDQPLPPEPVRPRG